MAATLVSPAPPQTPTQPPVRIRRAPALEPPADEDRPADDHPICAGQLALFTSVNSRPATPPPPTAAPRRPPGPGPLGARAARTGPPRGSAVGPCTATDSHPPTADPHTATADPRPPAAGSHPPTADPRSTGARRARAQISAARFVSACVEVLNGFRPVSHLRALTGASEFAAVATQLTRRTVRVRLPDRARVSQERVRLRRLQVFEQPTGVAEAVAVLRHGDTAWAMALRFEHHRGRWLCTLLEVI